MFSQDSDATQNIYGVTYYQVYSSDIVLTEKSIIFMGKDTGLVFSSYVYPIELIIENGKTSLTKARIIEWKEKNENIQIEIKDPNYKKAVNIEIKTKKEVIKEWLTKNKNLPKTN